MATDRRRAVATASTGAGLTVAGGVLRQQGLTAAHGDKHPPAFEWRRPVSTHQTRALLRTGARGRNRYLLGATLGLVGAPALAVGVHDTVTRQRVEKSRLSRLQRHLIEEHGIAEVHVNPLKKNPYTGQSYKLYRGAPRIRFAADIPNYLRDFHTRLHQFTGNGHVHKREKRSFVGEGLRGTQGALEQRAEGIKEVPPQHKAGPLTVSAGAGLVGSLSAHRGLDRLKSFRGARHSARAGLTALAGTTLAGASYPLARHTVRSNDYEVTPAGVRRRKKPLVRPSSKSTRARTGNRSFTADMSKVHNPHNLTPTTARGTARKVHWRNGADDHAVCGLDGAFGRGTGPFAEHYGEVTCRGCARMMRIRKASTPAIDFAAEQLRLRVSRRGLFGELRGEKPLRAEREKHLRAQALIDEPDRTQRRRRQDRDDLVRQLQAKRARYNARAAAGLPATPPRHIRKADYAGRRTSSTTQRAAILAAGATPVIGGVAGARTAGHFAPPGRRGKTEARQYGLTTAGSLSGGLAGAYGTAALASRHAGVARATERASAAHGRASEKVRSLKPVNATMARLPKGGRTAVRVANVRHAAAGSKLARPLMRSPIAAGVGYVAGKTVGGFAGSGIAMRRNQRDQRAYNLKHPVTKSIDDMTVAERRKLSRKKRYAAASSTTTGVLGLGALAARAKKRPDLALNLLTGSAAIGGVNNLNFAGVLRREAKAQNPDVKKGLLVAKADHREPLTRMRADQAAEIVRRHGDAGPLPSNLSRSERMQAYEARYVHAGGHKAEHWQRRADRADKVKVAGLAGATAGGAAIMALRSPRLAARLGQRAHAARHAADSATIGAATVSGAGELYAGHARRRRASYSSSKAGVAASALRRMKDYAA